MAALVGGTKVGVIAPPGRSARPTAGGARSASPAEARAAVPVRRWFTAAAPNQLWLTDITEHRTAEGKLACARSKTCTPTASSTARMKSRLAVNAIDNAVARRAADGLEVAGCIVHSDRGSQSGSRKLVHALNRHQLSGSLGRVGAVGAVGAIESFFALLQK